LQYYQKVLKNINKALNYQEKFTRKSCSSGQKSFVYLKKWDSFIT